MHRTVFILVGLMIGLVMGFLVGWLAEKPVPPDVEEARADTAEQARRQQMDNAQAEQLDRESQELDVELQRLLGSVPDVQKPLDDYRRHSAGLAACGAVLRSLEQWGQRVFGEKWKSHPVPD